MIDRSLRTAEASVAMPMPLGEYQITSWDTIEGRPVEDLRASATDGALHFITHDLAGDRAIAVRRIASA